MTMELIIQCINETMKTALLISAPMLIIGLLAGLMVAIFQAVTQIQEMTLTFIPKIVGVCAPKPINNASEIGKFEKQHNRMNDFANGGIKRVVCRLAKRTLLKNNVIKKRS